MQRHLTPLSSRDVPESGCNPCRQCCYNYKDLNAIKDDPWIISMSLGSLLFLFVGMDWIFDICIVIRSFYLSSDINNFTETPTYSGYLVTKSWITLMIWFVTFYSPDVRIWSLFVINLAFIIIGYIIAMTEQNS